MAERAEIEKSGCAVAEIFGGRGCYGGEIRADTDGFDRNVGIGFFGTVEVGLRDGDQCVGAAVGTVGATGKGQQVVGDFF